MESEKIELIRQALAAAESSIGVAKRLLGEGDRRSDSRSATSYNRDQQQSRSFSGDSRRPTGGSFSRDRGNGGGVSPSTPALPSDTGIFDGQDLVFSNGSRIAVPSNQVAKSLMVAGDQLKKVDENGETLFKQIQRVKRKRLVGILVKKEGRYSVLTDEGSYRVSDDSVGKQGIKVEDQVAILTSGIQKTPWAVIEQAVPKADRESELDNGAGEMAVSEKTEKVERKKVDKKDKEDTVKPGADESKSDKTLSQNEQGTESELKPIIEEVDLEELR